MQVQQEPEAPFSLEGEGLGMRVSAVAQSSEKTKKPSKIIKNYAKNLRRNMTDSENRIWYYLRNRRLNGYKFVRQLIIDNYIADFVCREKKLIVEIDGGQHMDSIAYDCVRTKYLQGLGYRVLRVWNHEVFENIEGVMEGILYLLEMVP